MPPLKSILVYNRIQFRTLLLLVMVFISLVGLLSYTNKLIFERFLGSVTPLVIAVVISILGIAAFALLLIDKDFVVYKKKGGRSISLGCSASSIICFDCHICRFTDRVSSGYEYTVPRITIVLSSYGVFSGSTFSCVATCYTIIPVQCNI